MGVDGGFVDGGFPARSPESPCLFPAAREPYVGPPATAPLVWITAPGLVARGRLSSGAHSRLLLQLLCLSGALCSVWLLGVTSEGVPKVPVCSRV